MSSQTQSHDDLQITWHYRKPEHTHPLTLFLVAVSFYSLYSLSLPLSWVCAMRVPEALQAA